MTNNEASSAENHPKRLPFMQDLGADYRKPSSEEARHVADVFRKFVGGHVGLEQQITSMLQTPWGPYRLTVRNMHASNRRVIPCKAIKLVVLHKDDTEGDAFNYDLIG